MALKDWKKSTQNSWYNKKKDIMVSIISPMDNSRFTVGINYKIRQKLTDFKSKSQALKFARNYMRTH